MGFFDEIIDASWLTPKPSLPVPDPPWLGAPHDLVPAYVETHLEFARAPALAVWITGASIFPSGISLALEVRWDGSRQIQVPLVPGERGRAGMCLGAQFHDGERVLALTRRRQRSTQPARRSLVVTPLRARLNAATIEIWLWPEVVPGLVEL
jgi:hypothetical protein